MKEDLQMKDYPKIKRQQPTPNTFLIDFQWKAVRVLLLNHTTMTALSIMKSFIFSSNRVVITTAGVPRTRTKRKTRWLHRTWCKTTELTLMSIYFNDFIFTSDDSSRQ